MTADLDRQTSKPGALVCPQCGATSPSDARICRRCYASLGDAERVDVDAASETRRWPPSLRRPSTRRDWLLFSLGLLAFVVVAWWLRGYLSGPPPPFPEVAGDRSVPVADRAWAMPNGGPSGVRRTAAGLVASDAAWRRDLSSSPSTSLVSDGDAVYLGLEEGVVVSVDAATGTERWRVSVPGVLDSAPAVAGNRVYLGYRSGGVAALDAATGQPIWEEQLGVSISTTPLVVDGILFVAGNGILGGFDAENGTQIWSRGLSDSLVPVTPVANRDTLVVGTFDRVLLFDRSNGELLSWVNLASRNTPLVSLAVDDGLILATADRQLIAIETTMRRPWWDGVRPIWEFFDVLGAAPDVPWEPDRWSVDLPSDALPAAVGDKVVVVSHASGLVRAYSRATGEVVWERQLRAVTTAPVMTQTGVLLAGKETCWLLHLDTGEVREECLLSGDPLDLVPVESGTFLLTSEGIAAALAWSS